MTFTFEISFVTNNFKIDDQLYLKSLKSCESIITLIVNFKGHSFSHTKTVDFHCDSPITKVDRIPPSFAEKYTHCQMKPKQNIRVTSHRKHSHYGQMMKQFHGLF